MVYRYIKPDFCKRPIKKATSKWIINDLPKTFEDAVYPQIPFMIRNKRYKIKSTVDRSVAGQLNSLTFNVTKLFQDERIVLKYNRATEIRPHVERLIVEAMRNGDKHIPTMELAKYWLRDYSLIHKLFKVFVPRYWDYASTFTALHMLGVDYSLCGIPFSELRMHTHNPGIRGEAVLEMRGNNLPPIIRPKLDKNQLITNILLDSARSSNATT